MTKGTFGFTSSEATRALERWTSASERLGRAGEISSAIRVVATTEGAGRGVATTRDVTRGELLATVPLEKCVSTSSARADATLWRGLRARPGASLDGILAAHVLREALGLGERSAFWPWLRLLPSETDAAVGWDEDELRELQGSNVVAFARAIKKSWREEYDALDFAGLGVDFPEAFGGEHAAHYTFEKFTWARFVVWSRAIDLKTDSTSAPVIRMLVPILDMANHAPSGKLLPRWDAKANAVKIYAGSAFKRNTELRFNYDTKPSQYFLLQYGFIPEVNPAECVEVTMQLSQRDDLRERKEALLRRHGLDPTKRNFEWKVRGLDYDLLAAARIIAMDESELDDDTSVALSVSGASVSAKNDARTKAVLLKSLITSLDGYGTTLGEDNSYIARFNTSSDELPKKRKRFAVLLRMREKGILLASADALFKELPNEGEELVRRTCEEMFSKELDECMKRASGTPFASYAKKVDS